MLIIFLYFLYLHALSPADFDALVHEAIIQGALGEAHHVDAALTADVALKHLIGTDAQVAILTQVAEEGLDVLDGADVRRGAVGHGRVQVIRGPYPSRYSQSRLVYSAMVSSRSPLVMKKVSMGTP